ncbi:MAG: hypothetical protein VKJ02_18150 [Snowella sp.]|nr:hypothetical protein [Snowella sp.]
MVLISLPECEIHLKPPTSYLLNHQRSLLPAWNWDWTEQPPTLILVLLQAKFSLLEDSTKIQDEKDRLLGKFIRLAQQIKLQAQQQNVLTEIIFPVDGKPLCSEVGTDFFNLPAIVKESLNYEVVKTEPGCSAFCHPTWNHAVYPGLLLANASIQDIGKKRLNLIFH